MGDMPAYDASPQEVEKRFYKLCHTVNTHERSYREAEKVWKSLYDFKDEFFNDLIFKCVQTSESGKPRTNADKEREVRATEKWHDFNKGLHDAEEAMLDAKVEFKIRLRNWETCRSLLSSKNVERKTGLG